MDIERINKRHFLKHNIQYRLEYDLTSRLLKYENCILFIEVSFGKRWPKPAYKTAMEIAKNWKNIHPELKNALGAKIYITDFLNSTENTSSKTKIKHKKGVLFNYWNKN